MHHHLGMSGLFRCVPHGIVLTHGMVISVKIDYEFLRSKTCSFQWLGVLKETFVLRSKTRSFRRLEVLTETFVFFPTVTPCLARSILF